MTKRIPARLFFSGDRARPCAFFCILFVGRELFYRRRHLTAINVIVRVVLFLDDLVLVRHLFGLAQLAISYTEDRTSLHVAMVRRSNFLAAVRALAHCILEDKIASQPLG